VSHVVENGRTVSRPRLTVPTNLQAVIRVDMFVFGFSCSANAWCELIAADGINVFLSN
jgi:hypothetical protein